jgi:hypothetical protein
LPLQDVKARQDEIISSVPGRGAEKRGVAGAVGEVQRVAVVSASIGAGHDGVAQELARRLRVAGYHTTRHDFLDMLPGGAGQLLRTAYAAQLQAVPASWGWLLAGAARPRVTRTAVALSAAATATKMLAVLGAAPVAVVSTYPLASQVIGWLRSRGRLPVPAVAFLTDPWVHPLCVASGVDLHLAPSSAAAAAALHQGATRALACAPAVGPAFGPARSAAERDACRRRFGLPVGGRIALIVAGSWGVGAVEASARDVAASGLATPVVVCARNAALHRRLSADRSVVTLGWVDDMPTLMRAADVVVHNGGFLSCLEAIVAGLPVISYRCLPGHGVANAAALQADGLAPWPRSAVELAAALHDALYGSAGGRASAPASMLACGVEPAGTIARLIAGGDALPSGAATEPAGSVPGGPARPALPW